MQEVNALSEKIASQSQLDLKDKKEDLYKKLDEKRTSLVTELAKVSTLYLNFYLKLLHDSIKHLSLPWHHLQIWAQE